MAVPIQDHRRYSAVILSHPRLVDLASMKAALGQHVGRAKSLSRGIDSNWSMHRLEYLIAESLYPRHLQDPEETRRAKGFAHFVYVGIGDGFSGVRRPSFLVASPYVRLLGMLVGQLQRKLEAPALQFVRIDMPEFYLRASSGGSKVAAMSLTLQMLGEPGLERVSLAGRSPLHSQLLAAIASVASPYAVGADVVDVPLRCRIKLDRHGNFSWYLADESRLWTVVAFANEISKWRIVSWATSSPLLRVEDPEE